MLWADIVERGSFLIRSDTSTSALRKAILTPLALEGVEAWSGFSGRKLEFDSTVEEALAGEVEGWVKRH